MRTLGLVRVALLGGYLATCLPAWATPAQLDEARRQLDELQYDRARASLTAALETGESSLEEVIELHRLSGEVAATLGEADVAQAAFERALSLRPSTTLPEGVSPKIAEPFEAARRKLGARKLKASARLTGSTVTVDVSDDPAGLVGGARAIVVSQAGAQKTFRGEGQGPIAIEVQDAAGGHVSVELTDRSGNVLAALEATGGTTEGALAAPAADAATSGPLYKKWWIWAGVSGISAAVGIGFGLSAQAAEDDLAALNERVRTNAFSVDYAEARALEDRARSRALGANIAFGVAGACAVTAIVMAVSEGGEKDRPPRGAQTTASVLPAQGGVTFAIGSSF